MSEVDITTLLQEEATQNQYIFNFVWMNLVFIVAYFNRNRKTPIFFTWMLILIFALYAFWGTDYFSFAKGFYTSLEEFRDPLYYYISKISFNSYTLFRFIIWGGAIWLYIKAVKRFDLSYNMSAFIFAVFYLMTFSFGRISLGIAIYCFGISILLNPREQFKIADYILGCVVLACSYWGHRAMILPIALAPLILLKPSKLKTISIIICGVVIGKLTAPILSSLLAGDIIIGSDTEAEEALLNYIANENELTMNWKFRLVTYLQRYGIYMAAIYCVWAVFFSKYKNIVSSKIKRLTTFCIVLFAFSFNLLQFDTIGANEIGERYLLILGLPIILILSYLKKEEICSTKTLTILLIPMFLFAEGFLIGKILSF